MYTYIKTTIDAIRPIINEHMTVLVYPLDSYLEDVMHNSQLYSIIFDGNTIGYFAIDDGALAYFYVSKGQQYLAASIFEAVVKEFSIEKVTVISSDQLLNVLLVEWDYERERMACFFTDSKRDIVLKNKLNSPVFRLATKMDVDPIRLVAGDFFDEEGSQLTSLEARIDADTIFILGKEDEIYGCGIIELGRICQGYASIGMFVNPNFRQKGVARTILLNLKEFVYNLGLEPIAGCWYYNTLSKASLESAGMVATSMGYTAALSGKDHPPKRTGNPPGELVD